MSDYRGFTIKADGKRVQARDENGLHFGYFPTEEQAKFAIDGYLMYDEPLQASSSVHISPKFV